MSNGEMVLIAIIGVLLIGLTISLENKEKENQKLQALNSDLSQKLQSNPVFVSGFNRALIN